MALVKLNNRGVRSATTFGNVSGLGDMKFIKKLTASGSSTLSFVDGSSDVVLDNTYKEYIFTWKDIHPSNDGVAFSFQGSTDTGSSYGVTMTTSFFNAYHDEADSATSLGYRTGEDIAQGTGYQGFQVNYGADNDQSGCGFLQLFNPSSTTFVKHFISRSSNVHDGDYSMDNFVGGYFNTTSAIDAIQFKMSLGNIDVGDICLYGIL
tara:strand:- start:15 stop:635 length:621 start_codon:yes stop_codon:yes gene_type:complete